MQLGKKNKIQRLKFLILLCCFNISQVILDVVYNHTNEADDEHPYTTSFRGIDNKVKFVPYGYFSVYGYYFTMCNILSRT